MSYLSVLSCVDRARKKTVGRRRKWNAGYIRLLTSLAITPLYLEPRGYICTLELHGELTDRIVGCSLRRRWRHIARAPPTVSLRQNPARQPTAIAAVTMVVMITGRHRIRHRHHRRNRSASSRGVHAGVLCVYDVISIDSTAAVLVRSPSWCFRIYYFLNISLSTCWQPFRSRRIHCRRRQPKALVSARRSRGYYGRHRRWSTVHALTRTRSLAADVPARSRPSPNLPPLYATHACDTTNLRAYGSPLSSRHDNGDMDTAAAQQRQRQKSRLLAGRRGSAYCGAVAAACRALVTARGGACASPPTHGPRGRGGTAVRSRVTSRKFSLSGRLRASSADPTAVY